MKKTRMIFTALLVLGLAGTVAVADHRAISPEERVHVLAYELEDSAKKLFRAVDRTSHHHTYWESRAVDEARRLKRQVKRLNDTLDRGYADAFVVNRQLRRIDRQLDRTTWVVRRSHAKNVVRKRLRDTRVVFRELSIANRDLVASSRRYGVELRHKNVSISADLGWLFERERREARRTRR